MSNDKRCTVDLLGRCMLHDGEVERRRSSDKYIDELKEAVEEAERKIDHIYSKLSSFLAFIAQIKVVGVIALVMWSGGFLYTNFCYDELMFNIKETATEQKEQEHRVAYLEANQMVNNEKFISLVEKLEITNSRLTQLINKL